MSGQPKIETYTKGKDVIYFSKYDGKYSGKDEVLQHQLFGVEYAHITLHPNGEYGGTEKRNRAPLEAAVKNKMNGYRPKPSPRLREFINKMPTVIKWKKK